MISICGGRTEEELFDFVETHDVYDEHGLSINTAEELFAYVFRKGNHSLATCRELHLAEKIRILKMHIDSLEYNLKVANAGLCRARREREVFQQMRLI